MKKLFALLLVMCLLPMSALAEMDEYGNVVVKLPGAQFAFVPIDGYCLTRETSASVFNMLGMSQRDMFAYMQEYGVYAMLYDEDFSVEMQVTAWESAGEDFDDMTAFGLDAMATSLRQGYRGQGWQVNRAEAYRSPTGHVFVCCEASAVFEDGGSEYVTEYLTCQANYAVSVLVYSMSGEYEANQRLLAEELADSLWITAVQ